MASTASIIVNIDNATPTPTTRDLLPIVKAQLGQSNGNNQMDAELALLADAAMQKYAELVPNVKRANVLTVQNQLSYPLPADCVQVLDVANPSQYGYYNDWLFLPMIDTPSSSLFGYSDYAFRNPSERIVRQGILTELDHYANSYAGWYTDGRPQQLYLLPTSVASGLTIIVRYAAEYANVNPTDPLNPSWTGLQAGHWKYLVRLIKWAVADKKADYIAGSMGLTDTAANTMQSEALKMANRADRILQEVRMALGVDATVTIRS